MEVEEKAVVVKDLFEGQARLLSDFFARFDIDQIEGFVEKLLECKGLIAFTGVGKSGLVAKKIAQTMTSTGTRSIFLSPTDALHGDMGILSSGDCLVILSKSGESDELLSLIPFVRNKDVTVAALVSNSNSRIAKAVDYPIDIPVEDELCPFNLAPTISTTAQMIVGDLIAISLMRMKGVTRDDFAKSHPAGRLGKRMILKVSDLMVEGDDLPLCPPDSLLGNILPELSDKKCGCMIVVDRGMKMR